MLPVSAVPVVIETDDERCGEGRGAGGDGSASRRCRPSRPDPRPTPNVSCSFVYCTRVHALVPTENLPLLDDSAVRTFEGF